MEKTDISEVKLPKPFLDRMKRLLGDEYEAFVQSYEAERVQGLRFNTLKGSLEQELELCRERFRLRQIPWCREGFYYDAVTRPGKHAYHEAGVYYIQEPSAMSVVSLLKPEPGDFVLDLCAAPGGKTTHIAECLKGKGLLVSNEIHPARAKILSQNVERMGIRNAVVTNEDSEKLARAFPEFFDKIVVDAPCSGEGMFRKDEQACSEWSEENVQLCAERQQMILDNAAQMLKPGGRLVYSTCTFAPEEDENGIAEFLVRHPEFSVVPAVPLPGISCGNALWCRSEIPEEIRTSINGTFRIWPHRSEGEGHYLALLEKCAVSENESDRKHKGKSAQVKFWTDKAGEKMVIECLKEIFEDTEFLRKDRLILYGEQVYMLPEGMPDIAKLRVLRPGLHLGTLKKNRMEPAHALALAADMNEVKASVNFPADSNEIAAYLNGNTLQIDEVLKGWVLVCTDGYSLGWGKASGGTLKNHYPKGLRRM